MELLPRISLPAIYGANLALFPRPAPGSCAWLPQDPVVLEMLTGSMLTIAGDMPVVCAASVATPAGLQLLRDAGFSEPRPLLFRDDNDHDRHRSVLLQEGFKLVLQHAPYPAVAAPENYWIDPHLLSFLNNKGHLADLVEARYLPERRAVAPGELELFWEKHPLPLVVKVASDKTTGGGWDVAICRCSKDVRNAQKTFRHCRQVIVEEYLPISRNLCLNYAISPHGEITYLGSTEQITDQTGKYYGNWLHDGDETPVDAIAAGKRIAHRGFEKGYRGCVGMDMAILKNGEIRIYDLNFRINGSTAALLLADAVQNSYGQPVMRLAGLKCPRGFASMLDATYKAMHKGLFVPLVTCDPRATGMPGEAPRSSGLILGQSRAQIHERCARLQELGLEVMSPANLFPDDAGNSKNSEVSTYA
ncbi:hypothetical protein Pcar_1367 [Syntrophotalea carbinolica DSM 2380]|uniref:ATP-grasp domain-containing protein n=1 Tax=Syntrophotalea carbinolica (strain DSM 2380 / NBRC 103641 / GraBd1) TaxID=338963 RepID=Q3A4U3_SYNC1|nr:hypothetical protein [Syntrophotalea carbinolica]ABA88614.1 hypothetical protein Pcar_1367 [Syntrophotalea carbinolica DSM 2380]